MTERIELLERMGGSSPQRSSRSNTGCGGHPPPAAAAPAKNLGGLLVPPSQRSNSWDSQAKGGYYTVTIEPTQQQEGGVNPPLDPSIPATTERI